MMYPFMTLADNTEIVHSELQPNGEVKVYIERSDAQDGFHHAACRLPQTVWDTVSGFSSAELDIYLSIIESLSPLIFRFAREGGLKNSTECSIGPT